MPTADRHLHRGVLQLRRPTTGTSKIVHRMVVKPLATTTVAPPPMIGHIHLNDATMVDMTQT